MDTEQIARKICVDWYHKLNVHLDDGYMPALEEKVARAIRDAVAAEREACAKIAEQAEICNCCHSEGFEVCSATGDIADAIRARGEA